LTHVIPARRPASPEASSRLIFHDLFGVRRVLLPLLTREKSAVLNATPSAPGPGMCRSLAGSVRHTSSRAPGGASALRQHIERRRETRNVEHVHAGGEELVLGVRCLSRLIHARTPWMISLTVRYGGTVATADTWSETAAVVLIHR